MDDKGRRPGQVTVSEESRTDVITHDLWKQGITEMFGIIIVNLYTGSYLRMPQKRILQRCRCKRRTDTFRLAWSIGIILPQWSTLQIEFLEWRS